MTTFEIIQLFIGSGGLIGILIIAFHMGKFSNKIESMDKKIDQLENALEKKIHKVETAISDYNKMHQQEFDFLKQETKEMQRTLHNIQVQVGKLETRVEERTLRVVKDICEPAVR